MMIKFSVGIPHFIFSLWWFLNDRCTECGGEVEPHINGKYYCNDCNTIN